jgi:uncharacterized phage infection (PIP) family protein YhgE
MSIASGDTGPVREAREPPAGRGPVTPRVSAAAMLYQPAVWLSPVVIGTVLFGLISLTYLGVIVNPTSHLRGLPVVIVNEDSAPPHFSADVTALASGAYPRGQAPALPTLTLLTNVRAGSLGVSLAMQITRWHTLIAKWVIAAVTTPLLVAVVLAIAAGVLRMDAPHLWELWLFGSYAAATIAIGTLALTAALGTLGQMVALLVFVYVSLASSGGTIPLQAVPGVYQFFANFEPLRQILGGTRAVLYFNGIGDAGLNRGLILVTIGLAVGLVIGAAATLWYDHTGRTRRPPQVQSATTA